MSSITSFDTDISNLTKNERQFVEKMKKVGLVAQKIWDKQFDMNSHKQHVYFPDATRDEILRNSKKKKDLLDPYSVVKRDEKGNLYAVKYSDEYKSEIAEIVKILKEIKEVEDRELIKYIGKIIKAFEMGEFEDLLLAYLEKKQTDLSFTIGFFETYPDKLLGVKRFIQFDLRNQVKPTGIELEKVRKVIEILSIPKPMQSVGHDLSPSKVAFRVDDALIFGGLYSTFFVSSSNLPNEPELVDKYGTKIVVYRNSAQVRFEKQHLPLLKYFVDEPGVTPLVLKKTTVLVNAFHQLSASLVKYPDSEHRLFENYDSLRELNAGLFGLKSAKYHIVSGIYSQELYKAMLLEYILNALNIITNFSKDATLVEYVRGFSVVFNHLVQSRAISVEKGKIKIDFIKLSVSLDMLSDVVHWILRNGTYEDSQNLFEEFGNIDVFEPFLRVIKR